MFLLVLSENIAELASKASLRERAWSARKKNRLFFSSPTPTPLRWRSINPLRFIFHHARSTDVEEKIGGSVNRLKKVDKFKSREIKSLRQVPLCGSLVVF